MSGAPSTCFHASLVRGTILRRRGGITVSNADDERQEPTRSYGNRGIYLPGLRSARQRLGLTQRDLAARARTGQHPICKLETLRRGGQGVEIWNEEMLPVRWEMVKVSLKDAYRIRRIYRRLAGMRGRGSLHGLTVFIRHENVVRLLEFLGYRQEE
jgi:hypothetical protein